MQLLWTHHILWLLCLFLALWTHLLCDEAIFDNLVDVFLLMSKILNLVALLNHSYGISHTHRRMLLVLINKGPLLIWAFKHSSWIYLQVLEHIVLIEFSILTRWRRDLMKINARNSLSKRLVLISLMVLWNWSKVESIILCSRQYLGLIFFVFIVENWSLLKQSFLALWYFELFDF